MQMCKFKYTLPPGVAALEYMFSLLGLRVGRSLPADFNNPNIQRSIEYSTTEILIIKEEPQILPRFQCSL